MLVKHLENDECQDISGFEFSRRVQQKQIVRQIMVNPQGFYDILHAKETELAKLTQCGKSKELEKRDGGVSVLDEANDNQSLDVSQDGSESMDDELKVQRLTRKELNQWPQLPHKMLAKPQSSAKNMQQSSSIAGKSGSASNAMARPAALKLIPNTIKQGSTSMPKDADAQPWSTGATSKTLFPNAKLAPASDGQLKCVDSVHRLANDDGNLLKARFWDASSRDFNVEPFYNAMLKHYLCPFSGCGNTYSFAREFVHHLNHWHGQIQYRCLCLKVFKTAHAMIGHSESPGSNCQARKSPSYQAVGS